METFPLVPHPQSPKLPIKVNCTIGRKDKTISVAFQLADHKALVLLPEKKRGERVSGLWYQTCFELFFSEPDVSNYWEVNLSPSTSWNIFSFVGNRRGMATEDLIQQLPVLISRDARSGTFSIAAKIHLDKLHLSGVLLNVGVGAVLQTKDEQLSHWALVHPKPRPDFHNRASFVLEL